MSERAASTLKGLAWTGPFFIGFFAFMLLPAILSLFYAFTDYSVLEKPVWVGLANFREMWTDATLWQAARNTILYTLATALGSTFLAVAIAILIESARSTPKHARWLAPLAEVTRTVVFAPTLVPVVAAALAWLWVLNTRNGTVNAALSLLGITGPDWIGSSAWALPSIVLVSLWSIGSYVLIHGAALRGVPATLYEAATIDGAGLWSRFRHVTLPMISPAIVLNIVMSLIWSLQAFAVPLVMTRGGPGNATLTYAMHVYSNAFVYSRMGYACALAWVQFIVTLALVTGFLALSSRFVYTRGA